jgi:hypothetical protein
MLWPGKRSTIKPQYSIILALYRATKEEIKVSHRLPQMHGKAILLP